MGERRADIEGLRAVAVVGVVLYHAGWTSGGYAGVDVFFVLSGFLITGLLWRELDRRRGALSLAGFYARRARRLLPAAVLVLLVTLYVSARVLSPLREHGVTKDVAAAAVYGANYRFALAHTDYLTPHVVASPVQHYWSLGVEEQFYLCWPLLLLVAWRIGRRCSARVARNRAVALLLTLGVASFALSWWLTAAAPSWAFFSLPTRAWELVAGAVLALLAPRLQRVDRRAASVGAAVGIAAVLWSFVALDGATPFPGVAALAPVLGTALVVAAGCASGRPGPVGRVLAVRPLQLGGRISYAWYLWHWPMLTLAPEVLGHSLSRVGALVVAALSAVLAWATVRVVEEPVRFARGLGARPAGSLTLGAALSAGVLVASAATATSLPALHGASVAAPLLARGSEAALQGPAAAPAPARSAAESAAQQRLDRAAEVVVRAVAASVDTRAVPANLDPPLSKAYASKSQPFEDGCDNAFTDAELHTCAYAATSSRTRIVLFGDSHAAQWFPAFDAIAKARQWRLENLTKATCPPIDFPMYSPVLHHEFWECDQWRRAAIARIVSERPAVVVIDSARHYGPEYGFHVYSSQWVAGLRDVVRQVGASGARIIVLGPTPLPVGVVPDCLASNIDAVPACERTLTDAVNRAGSAAERAALRPLGVRYVDVWPWLCTSARCPVIVGNVLVYRDDNHVTVEYARELAPVFSAELDVTLATP